MPASVSVSLWSRIWESSPRLSKILATTKHYKKTFLMKQLLSSTNSRFRTQTLKSSPTSCFICQNLGYLILLRVHSITGLLRDSTVQIFLISFVSFNNICCFNDIHCFHFFVARHICASNYKNKSLKCSFLGGFLNWERF